MISRLHRGPRWAGIVPAAVAAGLLAAMFVSPAAALAKTKLVIATHFEAGQKEHLEPYFAEYMKLRPDVEIEHLVIPFDSYLQKIQVAHAAGAAPDIVHLYSLWGAQFVAQKMLTTPPPAVQDEIAKNYVAGAVGGATVEGKAWGYPTEIDNYMLLYNKRILSEAGYGAPPRAWDDLIRTAKRLSVRDSAGKMTRAGFAYLQGWDSAVVHPYLALLYSNGGEMFAPGFTESWLDKPQAVQALAAEVRMFTEGGTEQGTSLWTFPSGNVAMVVMAPWWESALKQAMGANFADVGVAPIPVLQRPSSVMYTWFFAVEQSSKHQREAWEFLQWLNGKREDARTSRAGDFLVQLGIIPSRHIDVQNHPDSLMDAYTKPFIDALPYSRPEPNVYRGQEIKVILMNQILKAWRGSTPARAALADAKRLIDPILAEYYK